jgi:hypothetical protein
VVEVVEEDFEVLQKLLLLLVVVVVGAAVVVLQDAQVIAHSK